MSDIEDYPPSASVTFTKSEKKTTWLAKDNFTILELAEQAGLKPKFGCRSAICGSCEVKITKGQVYGPEGDKPQGIFICQSRPATREIEIEL
jgi:ferredoxin